MAGIWLWTARPRCRACGWGGVAKRIPGPGKEGTGQGIGFEDTVLVGLKPLCASVLHPLAAGVAVAAPRRQPDPDAAEPIGPDRIADPGKAVGEPVVRLPQRGVVVPALHPNFIIFKADTASDCKPSISPR